MSEVSEMSEVFGWQKWTERKFLPVVVAEPSPEKFFCASCREPKSTSDSRHLRHISSKALFSKDLRLSEVCRSSPLSGAFSGSNTTEPN